MKGRNNKRIWFLEKDKQKKFYKQNLQDARKQIQRNQKRRSG